MRTQRDYVEDLLAEIEAVERFTAQGEAAFMEDERSQYAVMMAYARIGEIVKHISEHLLATQSHVEWRDIKGFRDVLLHRYFGINMERVWEAVTKLPTLKTAAQVLLFNLTNDNSDPDDSKQ